MACRYKIWVERNLATIHLPSSVTVDELLLCMKAISHDPSYRPNFDGLVDVATGSLEMAVEDLDKVANELLATDCKMMGRWALLVTSPRETAYGILLQNRLAQRYPFAIFSTKEGAMTFISGRNHRRHDLGRSMRSNPPKPYTSPTTRPRPTPALAPMIFRRAVLAPT